MAVRTDDARDTSLAGVLAAFRADAQRLYRDVGGNYGDFMTREPRSCELAV